jgi:hypothetical protein
MIRQCNEQALRLTLLGKRRVRKPDDVFKISESKSRLVPPGESVSRNLIALLEILASNI